MDLEKPRLARLTALLTQLQSGRLITAQTAKDIGGLWQRLMAEQLIAQIPNKTDTTVYCVYTDYEMDHTGAYTAFLGCQVNSLNEVPNGMQGTEIPGGDFQKFICRGDLGQGVVYGAWASIWNEDLDRVYRADYEVYGPKALNPADAEVEIFVGLR